MWIKRTVCATEILWKRFVKRVRSDYRRYKELSTFPKWRRGGWLSFWPVPTKPLQEVICGYEFHSMLQFLLNHTKFDSWCINIHCCMDFHLHKLAVSWLRVISLIRKKHNRISITEVFTPHVPHSPSAQPHIKTVVFNRLERKASSARSVAYGICKTYSSAMTNTLTRFSNSHSHYVDSALLLWISAEWAFVRKKLFAWLRIADMLLAVSHGQRHYSSNGAWHLCQV